MAPPLLGVVVVVVVLVVVVVVEVVVPTEVRIRTTTTIVMVVVVVCETLEVPRQCLLQPWWRYHHSTTGSCGGDRCLRPWWYCDYWLS